MSFEFDHNARPGQAHLPLSQAILASSMPSKCGPNVDFSFNKSEFNACDFLSYFLRPGLGYAFPSNQHKHSPFKISKWIGRLFNKYEMFIHKG